MPHQLEFGMKRTLPVLGLLALVLVVMAAGCGRAPRYDQRLVQADSLMQPAPDSALAIVEAVNRDSLADEGDRAYRDLLLTQARYRCYIVATSDSDINRALSFYRRHNGEREKLTRAYIYKGAVMDELGHPDSAMYYYKYAEASLEPNDYFNLAYVNLRMGALYRDHFSIDGKDIENYETANRYLELTDEKDYKLRCKINLGSLLRLNDPKKSEAYLKEAMTMAQEMKDTINYLASIMNLVILYDHYENYQEARKLINQASSYPIDKIGYLFLTTSAKVYAILGMSDSSEYFMKLADSRAMNGPLEKLSHFDCLSEISRVQGDTLNHLRFSRQCKRITDSLKSNQETVGILKIERQFDQAAKVNKDRELKKIISCSIGLSVIMLLILILFYYRKVHRFGEIIAEIKRESTNQLNDLSILNHNIEKLKIQDDQLKSFILSHQQLMRDMIEACYHAPRNRLSDSINHIVKYQKNNKDQWEKLYNYIDIEYNNIMTETHLSHPNLNSRDLLLLALTCLGYSCAQIAIIMGYSNATSISSSRQRLAKKMGLSCSLNEYIDLFIHHN